MDIMKLTPDQLERFIHLQSIVGRQENDAAKVRDLRAYYDGDHPVMLTQRQQEFLGPLLTQAEWPFSHNLAKSVVDTIRERLAVNGFTVNGKGTDDTPEDGTNDPDAIMAGLFWQWWTDNRMDSQQIRLYRRALRDGAAYIMVDFDGEANRPRLTVHSVDEGKVGVVLHRDPSDPNRVLFANRYFYTFDPLTPGETGKMRKTTYLPGEVRKYQQDSKAANGWMAITDEEDNGVWPLPWRDKDGKPLGVALIEFQNPGGSELGQIIGLQNAHNKSTLDLLAAADAHGFPIIAVDYADANGGMVPQVADDNNIEGADEFTFGPGQLLETFGATSHRIPGADLSSMLAVIDHFTNAISGVSRIPAFYLKPVGGGDVPSGRALEQLESGLVNRARERQLVFGQAWEDVFALAAKVNATYGNGEMASPLTIGVSWDDANRGDEVADAETAKIHKELGVPGDVLWQRLGYSPEMIKEFKAAARLENAQTVAAIASAVRADQVRNAPQSNPARGGA